MKLKNLFITLGLVGLSCVCQSQVPVAETTFERVLVQAYENQQSHLQIQGQGRVIRLLPDDLNGSRHQRFIIQISNGQTLLVAHNIDLAPRVEYLKVGEMIEFYGEYEWNAKGGVIHWTHHDPKGKHPNGWLKYHAHTYR